MAWMVRQSGQGADDLRAGVHAAVDEGMNQADRAVVLVDRGAEAAIQLAAPTGIWSTENQSGGTQDYAGLAREHLLDQRKGIGVWISPIGATGMGQGDNGPARTTDVRLASPTP